MGKVNLKGVIVGGLVAGLVLNLCDFLTYGVVLAADMETAMQAIGRSMKDDPIWLYVVLDFLFGIWLVWLYAMIRPRYGPGPRTAVIAGLYVWVGFGVLHAISEAPMGIFPPRLSALIVAVFLLVAPLAALAGAKFYSEPSA